MADNLLWEYRSITLGTFWSVPKDEDMEATLNELGAEGWEAVNAFHEMNSNKVRIVLKRPLSADNARRLRRNRPV